MDFEGLFRYPNLMAFLYIVLVFIKKSRLPVPAGIANSRRKPEIRKNFIYGKIENAGPFPEGTRPT